MIFRLSQKLQQKIGVRTTDALPLDTNPFADWSANLFTAGRVQFILTTNTKSLYSAVMYGRGITNENQLVVLALAALREAMMDEGQELIYRQIIAPASSSVRFAKALNRSVTGSIVDLVKIASTLLSEDGLTPREVGFDLNKVPLSMLNYRRPREALLEMAHTVASHTASQ